jgi:hypothetical protein
LFILLLTYNPPSRSSHSLSQALILEALILEALILESNNCSNSPVRMSSRRSGRAKAPVKYTSASETSDLEDKKPRKKAPPKKRTKTEQDPSTAESAPKKRAKKSPETLAAEQTSKQEKTDKATHKAAWEAWVSENALDDDTLLDEEPGKEDSITQTDSLKRYGLKATELGSLKHFEKRNPVYNNTMKLFREEHVKVLGFRKAGMLAGETEEKDILEKGEEVWRDEYVYPISPCTRLLLWKS